MTKRRKALNVVNETIVLSDSENEEVQLDNDDIQVIDVAEASQTVINPTEEETAPSPKANVDPAELTFTVSNPKLEPLAHAAEDPPVINIDDEPDPDDDDDGIEVVGIVLAGRRSSRTKEKRASLNRRSSGSNSSLAMELVSKAKNVLRRSASNSSSNIGLGQRQHYNLNKLSSKSKKIGRNNNKWKNNKFHMRDGNFRGRPRNALTHNRSREYNRQVIFRPDNNQAPTYIPFNPGNFSFETNPFAPCSTSTPAFNRHVERNGWIQKKRGGPAPIAPGSNIMNAGESVTRAPGTLRPVVIDGSNVAVG